MLTRRNFFVILIMFLVVFVMFMSVDISAGYLTRREYNPQADIPVTIRASQVFDAAVLNADESAAGENAAAALAADNPRVGIIAADEGSVNALVIKEWCVYARCRYQVYNALPEVAEIADCTVLLFDGGLVTPDDLPRLTAYADAGVDMIFTALPDYQTLQAAPELADFFGIGGFVQESLPLKGFYIFDEFFLGGDRIYALEDIYGENDADVPRAVPYYTLRPGYLMFAQAIAEDASIDYKDLPGLLWRTCTGKADVFCVNTDAFGGKSLLGLITAFMSQREAFYLYPVVNAQTISVVDFPMLTVENQEQLSALYSRTSEALGRDVLWPAIVKILGNYGGSHNFFMAPQLDYADENHPSGEFITFYRQGIERLSGTLGLSLQQRSEKPLAEICRENAAFLAENMPEYVFTAASVTREQLAELASDGSLPAPLERVTLLMTDADDTEPLMAFVNEETLAVSYTTDGYVHESMDDLRLMCIETALGMNNQKVELSQAFYPAQGEDWNMLNLRWSRGDTYQKPYRDFDAVTVYGLDERVRTFLSVDYAAALEEDVLTLEVTNGVEGASFVLRLIGREVLQAEGGEYTRLSDTAYLLRPEGAQMKLHLRQLNVITDAPDTYQEVIKK